MGPPVTTAVTSGVLPLRMHSTRQSINIVDGMLIRDRAVVSASSARYIGTILRTGAVESTLTGSWSVVRSGPSVPLLPIHVES